MPASHKSIRVGVDVGGTFTKAVAIDLDDGAIVARSVHATTHTSAEGVAAGVVRCVADVAESVGADNIALVTHSTTQAVNALLEGDVGSVGVIGLGRRPELKRARERTELKSVELAEGKYLTTHPAFFDVTDGFPTDAVRDALKSMSDKGVSAVCVAEAFIPDDDTNEQRVAQLASDLDLPVCTSAELSGLYGLELRAVTAALNSSILPIATRTARFVADGVTAAGIHAPVMVMRGDGGATDLAGFVHAPARTLYSGPAASVAGALRHSGLRDGVVVEVGGTSTNVAAVRHGRPALSYVQVASHSTALRAVDVRVVGVAGGSMLRARRNRLHGVGPRSAHIAGLAYACFTDPQRLAGCRAELISPMAGDPAEYVVVRLTDGTQVAITNTCAANALGITEPDDYCYAPPAAAEAALGAAALMLRLEPHEIARRMLEAAGEEVAELVLAVAKSNGLKNVSIAAVGGGAGGLGRHVANMLGMSCTVPEGAEVISSIGDALSLIRAERERTVQTITPELVRAIMDEVEADAIAAGAAPGSLDVQVEEQAETGTIRAIATGAVGLQTGARPGRDSATQDEAVQAAAPFGGGELQTAGDYWVVQRPEHLVVLDRFAEPVAEIIGEIVTDADELAAVVERRTRYRGPVTLRPSIWVLDGNRFVELSSGDVVASARAMSGSGQVFCVGRQG
ncbi:MAG: hydantoinase/oxoprolinase family protein [Acidimicrobiia bacterium]